MILTRKEVMEPVIVHVHTDLKSETARVILANSITLTPGTITVSMTDDDLLVHCLDKSLSEGMEDSVIQKRLLDSMDPVTSAVAKDILIQKYQLTVENYKASLTMLGTRLVQHVPRALIVYQKNKVDIEVSRLLEQMNTAPSDQHDEILQKISEYTKIRTRLNNDLGRV
jgi:hypothetical protein